MVPREILAFHGAVMRTVMAELSALTQEHGLTPAQISALFRTRAAGWTTPGRLSAELGLTSATTTHLLDRLQVRGLVERRTDPDDARGRRVHLTAAGDAFLRDFDAALAGGFDRLLAAVPAADLDRLSGALRDVLPHLGG